LCYEFIQPFLFMTCKCVKIIWINVNYRKMISLLTDNHAFSFRPVAGYYYNNNEVLIVIDINRIDRGNDITRKKMGVAATLGFSCFYWQQDSSFTFAILVKQINTYIKTLIADNDLPVWYLNIDINTIVAMCLIENLYSIQ